MKIAKRYLLILGVIFLLGLILRFYNLAHIPPGVHGDEAEFALREQKVMTEGNFHLLSLDEPDAIFNFSVLSYWSQGIFQRIFGENVFGIRASSAFAGVLTVLVFFLMTRQFFSSRLISFLLTFGLVTSHWHIAYSRLAINNIWTPLFMVVVLGFLYEGFRRGKLKFFIISGIVAGLSLYFAQANRAIPIVMFVWCIIHFFFRKNKKGIMEIIKQYLLLFASVGVVFLPLALYYIQTPGSFVSRIDTVSVFQHLPEYFVRYHVQNIFGVLVWQFINTVKVFNFGGDIGFYFYGYQGGLLAPIVGIFAVIGFFIACVNFKKEANLLLLVWFFVVVILGGVVTIDAPSSQRILGVIPVLFLFTGIAAQWLLKIKFRYIKIVLILLFLVNGLWDYKIYFVDYIHSEAGWAQREPATQVGYYLQSLGTDWKVYMLRENSLLYFHHGTVRFLNPNLEGKDVDISDSVIPIPEATKKNVVYIMPPDSSSLEKVEKIYPKGKVRFFFNPIGHTPFFTSYEIYNKDLSN